MRTDSTFAMADSIAAWEAATRWGIVRGNDALVTYGVTHYAMEAATARMYWLGEGLERPAGYAHTSAGIVWDAKIDYATWFDPKPESIIGIQKKVASLLGIPLATPDSDEEP